MARQRGKFERKSPQPTFEMCKSHFMAHERPIPTAVMVFEVGNGPHDDLREQEFDVIDFGRVV
eukprot:CAMPEP_0206291888 /NCGR_PEP_ID=MMETSP0106_2-20121207/3347_1 /ASSEMBLY_ACC=CAM_ASM_000206 /TAXON_ID=81532 /ORGANISM="Acanthoeca-like sp., Strain 10tr" /LENGTH=62 /DNA_ID=CAMNT_0053722453 /DNA_START=13 /DNA_END=201 /DNA_ORIENTATION=-